MGNGNLKLSYTRTTNSTLHSSASKQNSPFVSCTINPPTRFKMHPFMLISLFLPLSLLILAQQTPTIPLGGTCTSTSQCLSNAACYAVNSMLIPRCGNFQASCTNNSQCSYNTCVNGFCAGQLPLGSVCLSSGQCIDGAACYNSHPSISSLSYCGAWNATCTSDNQCAWNTCWKGTCSGAIPLGQICKPDGGSQCENGAECYYSPSKHTTDGICGGSRAQCKTDNQCFDHGCFKTSGGREYGTCTGNNGGNTTTTSTSLEGGSTTTTTTTTTTATGAQSSTTRAFYGNSSTITTTPSTTMLTTSQTSQGLDSCPPHASCVIVYPTPSESVVTISQITVITGTETHSSGGGSASSTAAATTTARSGAVRVEGMRGWVIFAVILGSGMGMVVF